MRIGKRAGGWAVAALLFVASGGALALLTSGETLPSIVRDPLSRFVWPGSTVWWFTFGSLFRTVPASPGEIAFAAAANAVLWSLLGVVAMTVLRRLRPRRHAGRPDGAPGPHRDQ